MRKLDVLDEMKPTAPVAKAMLQCPMLIISKLNQLHAKAREMRRGESIGGLRATAAASLQITLRAGLEQAETQIRLLAGQLGKSLSSLEFEHYPDVALCSWFIVLLLHYI